MKRAVADQGMPEFNAAALDPGIREVVVRLRSFGFETTDSGDGLSKRGEGRVFNFPHVAITVKKQAMFKEAYRLQAVLGDEWSVEGSFDPKDGSCILFASKPLEFNPDTMFREGLCS